MADKKKEKDLQWKFGDVKLRYHKCLQSCHNLVQNGKAEFDDVAKKIWGGDAFVFFSCVPSVVHLSRIF